MVNYLSKYNILHALIIKNCFNFYSKFLIYLSLILTQWDRENTCPSALHKIFCIEYENISKNKYITIKSVSNSNGYLKSSNFLFFLDMMIYQIWEF